ncbi:MAG: class I mannose-6-phosphate isomerase [Oscillospiraceae bacterium]|nr:class I mannose-6-phosphate isomerase [Oscillospiraceae bacterium]
MYPLKLKPAFKDYLWGGSKLKTYFNKACGYEKVAESWELSCHQDGLSVIENGEYAGMLLRDYIEKDKRVLGKNCEEFESLPILIKLIDASHNLSLQVHPNDEQGAMDGDRGKTELWYIIDCESGAEIIYGFNREISREEFLERIENNSLLEAVNRVKVKKGDSFFIPAGTLHAIGKGILIAEIQQSSNLTYRVYDYGRLDADGNPRRLDIKKAANTVNLCPAEGFAGSASSGDKVRLLAKCGYFTVQHAEIEGKMEFTADFLSFNSVLVLEGSPVLEYNRGETELAKGGCVFIPAGMGEYSINGDCEVLITSIPVKSIDN